MPNSPERRGLEPWQRIAAILFVVCLLVIPLYCAFRSGEGDLPPNPPSQDGIPNAPE